MYTENEVSGIIIDAAVKIHMELGPGLLESVYETILCYELQLRGLKVDCQTNIPVTWDGLKMDIGFRADLIVEDIVIVELKSVETLHPSHPKILLTYLKVSGGKLGLLLNFSESYLKNGIKRIVNNL